MKLRLKIFSTDARQSDTVVTDIIDCLAKIGMKNAIIGPIPLPVRHSGKGKRGIVANFIPVYSRILDVDVGNIANLEKKSEMFRAFSNLAVSNNVGIEMKEVE
ncbi:MAG: hypothetical protein M0P12_01690 [Paludibacteraceae bacterium]|nr:hypothetical protein [Paludibacteraceae bacterium]MCK9615991.1 hypothetical protein [Candidatus Omnitrophota bacterium]